ncbi:MAG: hypothetical protein IJU53_04010 [Thermoguttaceae bacterium]|nr:hypothetical protein [Thermoguttaceae bacterium]
MQDTAFYTSVFAVTAIISQVPEVQTFKEFSATVMLGVLFWYTLTRINTGLNKLTETINKLDQTITDRHAHTEEKE